MANIGTIIENLKRNGKRITKTRRAIIDIIINSSQPLSATDVGEYMKRMGIFVNKTTIYRELEFLKNEGIVRTVFLQSGVVHYESAYLPHYHRFVCNSCGLIQGIECERIERELENLTSKVSSNYKIDEHKLEFYGFCSKCK